MPNRATDVLAPAIAAARAGKPPLVLDALLDVWAATPAPAVAKLIDLVSDQVATRPIGLVGNRAVVAWRNLAARATASDLPALYATLGDAHPAHTAARVGLLTRPDPRCDAALVALIEDWDTQPSLSPGAYARSVEEGAAIRAVFPRLRAIRDPRLRARLAKCARPTTSFARGLAGALRPAPRPPPPAPPKLATLAKLLAPPTPARRHDLVALERAVYDNPNDDGVRLVYADALIEAGDPRGEFIASQLRGVRSAARLARERKVFAAYGKAWLGPLAPGITKEFRFERGFLDTCEVFWSGTNAKALIGEPRLATVRDLTTWVVQLATHPTMTALRSLRVGVEANGWRELLGGQQRQLERLEYFPHASRTFERGELSALGRCTSLPALRELAVHGSIEELVPTLVGAPVLARLDRLGLSDARRELPAGRMPALVRLLEAPRVRRLAVKLELTDWMTIELAGDSVVLTLGYDRRYRQDGVHVALAREAGALLAALGDRSVKVVERPGLDAWCRSQFDEAYAARRR